MISTPVSIMLRNRLLLNCFPFNNDAMAPINHVLPTKLSKYIAPITIMAIVECDIPKSWIALSGMLNRIVAVKNMAHTRVGSHVFFSIVFIFELKST